MMYTIIQCIKHVENNGLILAYLKQNQCIQKVSHISYKSDFRVNEWRKIVIDFRNHESTANIDNKAILMLLVN